MRDDAQLDALLRNREVKQAMPDIDDVAGMTMQDMAIMLRDAKDEYGNQALKIGLELTLNDGFVCEFIMKRKGQK
jgi:hypothetical protein